MDPSGSGDEFAQQGKRGLGLELPALPVPKPADPWKGLSSEYYYIVDNPKRLPFFLHPVVSREKAYSLTKKPQFWSIKLHLHDHANVPRKLYLNFDRYNLMMGTAGGLVMGLVTKHYFRAAGPLAPWFQDVESGSASRFQRYACSTVVGSRFVSRAIAGAVFFDLVKRNTEILNQGNKQVADWINPAAAGLLCGTLYGIRGGMQSTAIGAFGFSLFATLHHLFLQRK